MNSIRVRKFSLAASRGVAAVEFAIVFPLFFLIFYAIVSYGLIFVAQQLLTLAAENGAHAALAFNGTTPPGTVACSAATISSQSLGPNITCVPAALQTCTFDSKAQCLTVSVSYNYAAHPLVPILPGIGLLTPSTLSSSATVECTGAQCAGG
jgi:Flp pilus assembly protein TadG